MFDSWGQGYWFFWKGGGGGGTTSFVKVMVCGSTNVLEIIFRLGMIDGEFWYYANNPQIVIRGERTVTIAELAVNDKKMF